MTYKVVKYRLELDGTIPTWLKSDVSQLTGGMYPVFVADAAKFQDWIMIGIADDGADISSAIGEISSKSELQTYLTFSAITEGWKDLDSDDEKVKFDAAAHATRVWNDLDTLNS